MGGGLESRQMMHAAPPSTAIFLAKLFEHYAGTGTGRVVGGGPALLGQADAARGPPWPCEHWHGPSALSEGFTERAGNPGPMSTVALPLPVPAAIGAAGAGPGC